MKKCYVIDLRISISFTWRRHSVKISLSFWAFLTLFNFSIFNDFYWKIMKCIELLKIKMNEDRFHHENPRWRQRFNLKFNKLNANQTYSLEWEEPFNFEGEFFCQKILIYHHKVWGTYGHSPTTLPFIFLEVKWSFP